MTILLSTRISGGVKPIQRGADTVGTVTISAVDLNKATLNVTGAIFNGDSVVASGRLTSSTTIELDAANASATVYWEVIEYA